MYCFSAAVWVMEVTGERLFIDEMPREGVDVWKVFGERMEVVANWRLVAAAIDLDIITMVFQEFVVYKIKI